MNEKRTLAFFTNFAFGKVKIAKILIISDRKKVSQENASKNFNYLKISNCVIKKNYFSSSSSYSSSFLYWEIFLIKRKVSWKNFVLMISNFLLIAQFKTGTQ